MNRVETSAHAAELLLRPAALAAGLALLLLGLAPRTPVQPAAPELRLPAAVGEPTPSLVAARQEAPSAAPAESRARQAVPGARAGAAEGWMLGERPDAGYRWSQGHEQSDG